MTEKLNGKCLLLTLLSQFHVTSVNHNKSTVVDNDLLCGNVLSF